MPFDESLLRDETGGFDESLLRDDEPVEKRPIPKMTLGDRLSGPLFSGLEAVEGVVESLAHPIRSIEMGAEAAAAMISGQPKQLLVRPSEVLERPIVTIPQVPQQEGLAKQVGAGAANAVVDFANFFLTPEGIATLGIGGLPKAAQRNILKAFGAQMAVSAPQNLAGAVEQAKSGNYQEAAKHAVAAGAETFFARQMGRHAVEPPSRIGVTPLEPGEAPLDLPSQLPTGPIPVGIGVEGLPPMRAAPSGLTMAKPPEPVRAPPPELSINSLLREPDRPLEENQLKLNADDLRRAILENQGKPKGEPDAIQRSPEEIVQPVQTRSPEGVQEVPVTEGREQVSERSQLPIQPEEIKAAQVDELTKGKTSETQKEKEAIRETVAPTAEQLQAAKPGITPGAVELARQHFNDVAELQRQSAAAQKAAAAATRKARIERLGSGVAADSPASKAEQAAVAKAANYREALEAVEALQKPLVPSGEGLGIVPKGTGELSRIISEAIGAPKESPPAIKTDISTPLPDLQELGAAKKIFSQPFAFERLPILGAAFGGTRRLHGHVNDAISRYHGEIGVGKSISSALGNEYSWLDKALATPGAENARALKAISDLNNDFAKLEKKYGLEKEEVEAQDSMAGMLAERAERTYKSIAEKRLAQDKDLGGLSRKEKLAQLKASLAPDITSGKLTEADLDRMVDSAESNGRVFQPAFFNKIFQPDVAEALNKAFPNTNSTLRQSAASVNSALKSLKLGFDLAVGFIQGQALAARYPAIWGKAWFNSMKAFGSKEFVPDYVRKNIEPVRELAQMGSSVGQLQEYMAGAGKGQIVERIPLVGTAAKAFGRQFSTFLDVAKVEMWKAYRETTPKEEWMNVVQSLESVLQTARMESVGVGAKRALTERVLFLAPSYYRGGLNLIAAMAEKGTSGKIARQAMGAYAVGGAALFYGIGKMLGMNDEELLKRFNPARTDFMMWRYEKDGRATEVGLGGFYRSLMRLAGETAKTSIENPGNWKSLAPDKNPFVRWYRGHAGPVISTSWDAFTGKDYMGDDTDIPTVARRAITPLGLESIAGKEGEPSPSTAQKVGAVVGLSTFPETRSPATKEMSRQVRRWMATSDDPKVRQAFERREEEHSSTYGTLRKAIYTGDQKLFNKEVTKLLETRTESQVIKTLRQRANYPLTGSKAMERDFMEQLSAEDEKTYDAAKDAQITEYEKFLDMLDASGI